MDTKHVEHDFMPLFSDLESPFRFYGFGCADARWCAEWRLTPNWRATACGPLGPHRLGAHANYDGADAGQRRAWCEAGVDSCWLRGGPFRSPARGGCRPRRMRRVREQ